MIPWNDYFLVFPRIPTYNQQPPTVYSILESIVNYEKEPKTKIKDLAKEGRTKIFDFDYPLTNLITKEKFETMILNHFIMRRIGFETVTSFQIQLNVKLNEIMPKYNILFNSLDGWDLFNDGEIITKTFSESGNNTENNNGENTTTNNTTNNTTNDTTNNTTTTLNNTTTTTNNEISDRRFSDTPQNNLSNVQNGNYITNYNYDTNNKNSNDNSQSTGTNNNTINSINNNTINSTINNTNTNDKTGNYQKTITETENRSYLNKIELYKEFQENLKSIYGMIFKDLECLFYQLI